MQVKGNAIVTLPLFIKENFGEDELTQWLSLLSEEARSVYSGKIDTSSWYPLTSIFSRPTQIICDLFYDGDLKGAWACGIFSAEYSLRGILRFFVKLGSPGFIIKRAREVITAYYRPSEIKVVLCEKNSAIVRITSFPDMDAVVEARICGWIEEALLIHGCKEILINVEKSLVKNDPYSEMVLSWK